jgi:hypothetical protein
MSAPDDIVTRVRRWGDTVGSLGMMRVLHYEAADEIERLRAVLDAIDALHQPVPCDLFVIDWECDHCHFEHPCPTARLIHPMTLDEAIDTLGTVHK